MPVPDPILTIRSGDLRQLGQSLRGLLAAQLDSAADRELARLVQQSRQPVHLICDLTHRLLAASPARVAQFHVPASQLLGASLWRYATEDIVAAEAGLAGPAPPALDFHSRGRDSDALAILPCQMRWVRFRLSDGSFARLVETLADAAGPPHAGPPAAGAASVASQSAISPKDPHCR